MKGRVTNPEFDKRCKLNWMEVLIIRTTNWLTQEELAQRFNVTQPNIHFIKSFKTWRDE